MTSQDNAQPATPAQPAAPPTPIQPCTLSYPEKFYKAVSYVSDSLTQNLTHEARLLLYGLHKQATQGPCKDSKPWSWNVVEHAKYQSWKALGTMSEVEAMRLFVRTLDEEEANWWGILLDREAKGGDAAPTTATSAAHFNGDLSAPSPKVVAGAAPGLASVIGGGFPDPALDPPITGVFEAVVPSSATRPTPRYDHAAAMVGSRMVVHGGNFGGRYLGDTWVFDAAAAEWAQITLTAAAGSGDDKDAPAASPTPRAGHTLLAIDSHRVLCLGGFARQAGKVVGHAAQASQASALRLDVFELDLSAGSWRRVETTGTVPSIRRSHTASLVGDKVYLFGGEDQGRRALGDLHVLDTATWEWTELKPTGPTPAPRSAHTATVWQGRYVVVFGGGSVSSCYDDLHVFDSREGAWRKLELTSPETLPTARAGHSAAPLGRYWYIVGGGNNAAACTDVVALDLSRIPSGKAEWFKLGLLPERSPITSEGMSLVAVPQLSGLMTFGGYNGKYQNQLHLYVSAGQIDQVAHIGAGAAVAAAAGTANASAAPAPAAAAASQEAAPESDTTTPRNAPSTAGARASLGAATPKPKESASGAKADASSLAADLAAAQASAATLARELKEAKEVAGGALKEAHAARDAALSDAAALKRQVAALEKDLALSREAANRAEGKVMKLEVELAEARKGLEAKAELEKELAQAKLQLEEGAKPKQGGGGLWGYVSGNR